MSLFVHMCSAAILVKCRWTSMNNNILLSLQQRLLLPDPRGNHKKIQRKSQIQTKTERIYEQHSSGHFTERRGAENMPTLMQTFFSSWTEPFYPSLYLMKWFINLQRNFDILLQDSLLHTSYLSSTTQLRINSSSSYFCTV